jgi:hypothetical protein
VRAILWLLALSLGLLSLLSGIALWQGSLELFPTQEQEDKIRIVYGTTFILFVLLELGVIAVLRRHSRGHSDAT